MPTRMGFWIGTYALMMAITWLIFWIRGVSEVLYFEMFVSVSLFYIVLLLSVIAEEVADAD